MNERTERPPALAAALGVLGIAIVLGLWQALAKAGVLGTTLSAPTQVARVFGDDRERALLLKAGRITGVEALTGFLWAVVIALVIGLLVALLPPLRRGVDQLATIESAIPFVALAPILLATFERNHIPAAMAACTAFFPLYIGVVSGLHAVSPAVADVCTVFGSSRRQRLLRALVPAGIPVFATALKVAMPLAIVGAVIGEWFGASGGIGPIMLVAMRGYHMPTMWAAVTVTVVVAMVLFGVTALLERLADARFG
jgi:ABC-type nitrate/sulfonate/bicarbonate transport system permease component